MNGTYSDNEARVSSLKAGSFYHIITDLQNRLPSKGLGYTWEDAMGRVLLTAGDPLSESMISPEDYVPTDDEGNPLFDVPDTNGGITVTVND